ncbi:hypothetical protein MON38_14965 [Hymenobacter sp. DH14]|uniref:Uncharacterized protein n=1 Tax=Hymenobacter cyanobacteriorum TaxID=2926463 RepID=A0A9X1VM76_9BACT|nr:hypothetical protein [Hymenobacter cyanobacteriorum]MCI1188726.1 hypothetical protein [Hymenobacter cyanobacteriorum]
MPSVAIAPAAPVVGAAASKLAALRVTLARLEAKYPPRPQVAPKPAPAPVSPAAVAATAALARAHSAFFDARAAKYALRDAYDSRPGRFAKLRASVLRCREAQAAYAAAAAAYHASPAGAALRAARAKYPGF